MRDWLDKNPMTFMLYVVFLVVAIVGGVLVLLDSAGSMSFEDYLNKLTSFALAVGIFGAGRAVKNGILGGKDADGLPPDTAAVAVPSVRKIPRDTAVMPGLEEDEIDPALREMGKTEFDLPDDFDEAHEQRDIHEVDEHICGHGGCGNPYPKDVAA
jgi:hypothetical protein